MLSQTLHCQSLITVITDSRVWRLLHYKRDYTSATERRNMPQPDKNRNVSLVRDIALPLGRVLQLLATPCTARVLVKLTKFFVRWDAALYPMIDGTRRSSEQCSILNIARACTSKPLFFLMCFHVYSWGSHTCQNTDHKSPDMRHRYKLRMKPIAEVSMNVRSEV